MVRFLRIDPMVSGSSTTSAKLSLRLRRVASSLKFQAYESRGVSHREEGPGHCSMGKRLLTVH